MNRWRPALLLGAVVTAACLLPAPPAAAEDAAALVAKGRASMEKRDYPAARDAFLKAVEAAPKDVEARRGAAEALLGLGSSEEAIDQAAAGLEATGDKDAGLWLLMARGFLQVGDRAPDGSEEGTFAYADARAKANQALRLDPSLAGASAVLARVCRLTGDLEQAQATLRAGLEKSPRDFDLLFEQGLLHNKNGQHSSALEAFSKACETDPGSAEAHCRRGTELGFTGNWEMAYAAFARSATLDPAYRKPLDALNKYAVEGKIHWYRVILKEKPDHAWAHAYLALELAWGKAKDEAGALKEMKAALALLEGSADMLSCAGLVSEGLGRTEEAIQYYVKAFRANPADRASFAKLSIRACAPPPPGLPGSPTSSAKVDERKALVELLGAARAEDPVFWNDVGLMHRDISKDYRASLEAYLKAAPLAPDDQGIQNDTGLIYLYHGKSIGEDPKQSLPYFQRTFQMVQEDGQAPTMGYRDALENLAVYYMDVEKDPELALKYATMRNDPDFLRNIDASIAQPSQRAAGVKAWAEGARRR